MFQTCISSIPICVTWCISQAPSQLNPQNAKFSRTLETKTKKTVKTLFFFKYNKENNHA